MIIRPVKDDDISALADLAAKTFIETFSNSFTPEELETQLKETRSEDYFRSVIDKDTILLAIKDDRLTGYVQLSDVKIEVQGINRSGYSSFTIAYNVNSEIEVEKMLDQAHQAGGEIIKPAQKVFWGGYSGYFSDPDNHLWEWTHL